MPVCVCAVGGWEVKSYPSPLPPPYTPQFTKAADSFVALAASFKFGLDNDYQQDKGTPNWGRSPQPGPTYFFSKDVHYVHIINQHPLGDTDGPTRLFRNYFYIRQPARPQPSP